MLKEKNKKSIILCINKSSSYYEDIINLLSLRYDIKDIFSLKDMINSVKIYDQGGSIKFSPDVVFFTPDDLKSEVDSIYLSLRNKSYIFNSPKIISFGDPSLYLSYLNRASILKNITNHKETIHSCTFAISENHFIDYDIKSNHEHLIVPCKQTKYELLAFSTLNISDSYTTDQDETFKNKCNFLEIEGLKFNGYNTYCFFYEIPSKEDLILSDITLELIEK